MRRKYPMRMPLCVRHSNHHYYAYLDSPEWKRFRYDAMREAGWRCQEAGCNRLADDVHHLDYDRLGCERLDDVLCLCRFHHLKREGLLNANDNEELPLPAVKRSGGS